MIDEKKGRRALHLGGIGVALLLVLLLLWTQDFFTAVTMQDRFLKLSNAFTVAATLYLGLGALIWIADQEGFTAISYFVTHMAKMLIPGTKKKDERYYDYVQRKREKGKTIGYGFIPLIGLVLLVFAILFTVLFFKAA